MSKKLQGNGIWESSRMMLPEHKERIILHNTELTVRTKPVLDEQKLETLNEVLHIAWEEQRPVKLVLFDPREDCIVTGRIEKLDTLNHKIWVEGKWIRLSDMTDCCLAD